MEADTTSVLAYADESFQESSQGGYYVLASAVFEPAHRDEVRWLMDDLRKQQGAPTSTGRA